MLEGRPTHHPYHLLQTSDFSIYAGISLAAEMCPESGAEWDSPEQVCPDHSFLHPVGQNQPPFAPRWAQQSWTHVQRGMPESHLCSEQSLCTKPLPFLPCRPMKLTAGKTCFSRRLMVHPSTQSSFNSVPLLVYLWAFIASTSSP